MKKITAIISVCAVCMALAAPAFAAYNYDFGSGPGRMGEQFGDSRTTSSDSGSIFGTPTSKNDPVSPDPMSLNTRRNKDNSALPPPYFYGSGDIPTDTSSPFHDNTPAGAGNGYGGAGGYGGGYNGENNGVYNGVYSSGTGNNTNDGSSVHISLPEGFQASTSIAAVNTEPLYYDNGSIGTIYVARTGATITIYEGEQLDNLKKGAGHFSSTSAWDGKVALCGHNRGSWPYFSFVKDMEIGDRVTYTTKYGSRTYEVIGKEQIGEYDYSKLGWSAENLLSPKDVEVTHDQFIRVAFADERLASLQIRKIDEITGEPLAGAVFRVTKQNGEIIGEEYVTDKAGLIQVPTLAPGYYAVSEVKAPAGYTLDGAAKTVEVKTNTPTVVTFADKPLAGLKIIKLNSATRQPIEGVEFVIAAMNGEKVENDFRGYAFVTNSTGQIYVPQLPDGYYTVTETKQADGYILDSEPKTVLVQSGKPTVLEVAFPFGRLDGLLSPGRQRAHGHTV